MCIQRADAVNVMGGGKHFGRELAAAARQGGRGANG